MNQARSKDGTLIAYDRIGDGPPLILVDGALCHRAFGPNGPLAALLARHFTVFTYDRRGRGASGDTAPYAVEREVEDIASLIEMAGPSVFLYGISSGAALALEAANRDLAVRKLALYEAPLIVDDSRRPLLKDYFEEMTRLTEAGRRSAVVKLFMRRGVGVPAFAVAMMRIMPSWSKLKSVAHTLVYDTMILGDAISGRPLPAGRWAGVKVPTLVVVGSKSPAWMRNAMQALASVLPDAELRILDKQTHIVKPEALAPVLVEYYNG